MADFVISGSFFLFWLCSIASVSLLLQLIDSFHFSFPLLLSMFYLISVFPSLFHSSPHFLYLSISFFSPHSFPSLSTPLLFSLHLISLPNFLHCLSNSFQFTPFFLVIFYPYLYSFPLSFSLSVFPPSFHFFFPGFLSAFSSPSSAPSIHLFLSSPIFLPSTSHGHPFLVEGLHRR